MFGEEVRSMLVQVITSWQVLAATIVIIIYLSLVSYVVKFHDRPRRAPKPKGKKDKKAAAPPPPAKDEPGVEDGLPIEEQ